MRKSTRWLLVISAGLAVVFGAIMLFITWQHNPQCEFHCEGTIYWSNWLPYGVLLGVYAFVASFVIGCIFRFLFARLHR